MHFDREKGHRFFSSAMRTMLIPFLTLSVMGWAFSYLIVKAGKASAEELQILARSVQEGKPSGKEMEISSGKEYEQPQYLSVPNQTLPLTLKEAVVLALKNNLELMGFRYDPLIAQEDIIIAESDFDPVTTLKFTLSDQVRDNGIIKTRTANLFSEAQINKKFYSGGTYGIGVDGSRQKVAGGVFTSQLNPVNPLIQSDLFVNFIQPLLSGYGRDFNRANIEIAINAQKVATLGLVSQIRDLIENVETGYLDLVQSLRDLEVARQSLSIAEDLLAQNKIRVKVGTMAPIEILQAEAGVAAREEDVIVAQSLIKTTEDRLKRQIFLPDQPDLWRLNIEPTDKPVLQVVEPDMEASLEKALATDPQYQQAKLDVSSRDINLKVRRNLTLPVLNLEARAATTGLAGELADTFDPLVDRESYSWQVGLTFAYPLGNRGAKSEVRQGEMELERAKLSVKQVEYSLILQIRDLIRQVKTNLERARTTRISSRLSEENLAAERKKMEVGLSTSFQVLQFEENLTLAKNRETRAIIDHNKSIINLEKATGEIMEKFQINTKY